MDTILTRGRPVATPGSGPARPGWISALLYPLRRQALARVAVGRGHRILVVGGGEADLTSLAARGADVTAVEPDGGRRASLRHLRGPHGDGFLCLDPTPYGSHARYRASLDRVLFLAPVDEVGWAAVVHDLVSGGQVVAIDVLDLRWPARLFAREGTALAGACTLLPRHRIETRDLGVGRAALFEGWREERPTQAFPDLFVV